ncbi:MAG: fibrobacter succinogenes major paralogous domain-containing protein [Rikenellaceae bacterium]|nr:fibrobacter succinogenes major paralogous domain-containing protein [Rikenellaceae bacterium]
MEFPAIGSRDGSFGTLNGAGTYGYYWSSVTSTSGSSYAYYLTFGSSNVGVSGSNLKQRGYSVRCVR